MHRNPIPVECAGLVLCGPFIERLFAHLGYTEDGIFKDDHMPFRAAELLKYIAAGETAQHVHANALILVLCGLQPDARSVREKEVLTSDEKTEAEQMLESLVRSWNGMHELSTDELRRMFINRKGVLDFGKSWELATHPDVADILLNAVPWSWQLLKLPWMQFPLQTNWI